MEAREGGATLAARPAPCGRQSFAIAPHLRASVRPLLVGGWTRGPLALLNQAILTHDVGAWWADAARWLVRICDAGDTARR
jgi:hypothetical protein